ncbi:HET-domain-containing protein [Lentinus brumalis]|uniref:HET-domain-containing protein n=1 Tax=Lentinus brumalis TaxID=2498619 RepID=A0A371CKP3_9APHY|nr:HET-domain-containing protein [Polyporus brumalis]
MRLLDTTTGEFRWVEDPRHVRYAILSHVWAKKGDVGYVPEQTYQDVRAIQSSIPRGELALPRLSRKIRHFCEIARNDGFDLGWVDSACIDKTSSSELSEAINSMYNWYRYASACYAIIHDVSDAADEKEQREQFRSSKWFTRGWTLQELLAPSVVLFLSDKWRVIGSKHTLAPLIGSVTGIERSVLTLEQPLEDVSVARRMSWAASRETSREEDEAYSLMGIFGVNMPTTYGEGRYAFIRLQEEILKHIPDQTIFAWGPVLTRHNFTFSNPSHLPADSAPEQSPLPIAPSLKQYLLAQAPSDFKSTAHLVPLSREAFAYRLGISPEAAYHIYTTTSYGIHARFPLVAVISQDANANVPTHLALLACEDVHGRMLALLLRPQAHASSTQHFVGTIVGRVKDFIEGDGQYPILWSHYSRTTYLTLKQVSHCVTRGRFVLDDVYIPHRPSNALNGLERDASIHTALREARDEFEVRLAGWSRQLLSLQGYRVSPGGDIDVALCDRVLSRTLSSSASGVVLSNATEYISIQIGRCSCEFGSRFGLLGVLVSSRDAACVLEEQFTDEQHFINHPVHIHSWAFRCGIATKQVVLESSNGDKRTLRLTFTSEASDSNSRVKAYRLGVEVWETPASTTSAQTLSSTLEPPNTARVQRDNRDGPYLAPSAAVPMQRTRSNSAPYVAGRWPPNEDDHDSVETVQHTPAWRQPEQDQRRGSNFLPSPPTTNSDRSGRSNGTRSGRASVPIPRQLPPRGWSRDVKTGGSPGAISWRRSRSVDILASDSAQGYNLDDSDDDFHTRPQSAGGHHAASGGRLRAAPPQLAFLDDEDNHRDRRPKATAYSRKTTARAATSQGWSDPVISLSTQVRDRVPQVLRESPDPMSSSAPDERELEMGNVGHRTAGEVQMNGHDPHTYPSRNRVRSPTGSRIPVPKQRSATVGRSAFEASRPSAGPAARRSRETRSELSPGAQLDMDMSSGALINGEVSLPAGDKSQADRPRGGLGGGSNSASGAVATVTRKSSRPSAAKDVLSLSAQDANMGRAAASQEHGAVRPDGVDSDRPAPSGSSSSASGVSAAQSEPARPRVAVVPPTVTAKPATMGKGETGRRGRWRFHLSNFIWRHSSQA